MIKLFAYLLELSTFKDITHSLILKMKRRDLISSRLKPLEYIYLVPVELPTD